MEHVIDDCPCEGKKCKDCQEIKCLGHYRTHSNRSSLKPRCQICDNEIKYAWAKANPDKASESYKKYQSDDQNSEHLKMIRRKNARRWNQEHPELLSLRISEHRRQNREKYNSYTHKYNARKTQAGGFYTSQEWQDLKAKYNYTCLCCGRKEPEVKLTADHVIPLTKQGTSNIDNIQPLCKSCNSKKGTKINDFRP